MANFYFLTVGMLMFLGDTFGWIEELGARYVSVVTRDGKEYLIPNEDLITGQVVNWSHSNDFVRLDINFGTSYANDPHEVRRIAIDGTVASTFANSKGPNKPFPALQVTDLSSGASSEHFNHPGALFKGPISCVEQAPKLGWLFLGTAGACFGKDVIVANESLRDTSDAIALTCARSPPPHTF